jgi:hypothetical protein
MRPAGDPPGPARAARQAAPVTTTAASKIMGYSTVTAAPASAPAASQRPRPVPPAASAQAATPSSPASTWLNSWVANGSSSVPSARLSAPAPAATGRPGTARRPSRRMTTPSAAAGSAADQALTLHKPRSPTAWVDRAAGEPPSAR